MSKIIQRLISLGVDLSTKRALKGALKILGMRPENIDNLYIELKNDIHKEKFNRIQPEKKILFLPQCLRNSKRCKARLGESGYQCVDCCNCKASQIKKQAGALGYSVFIVPGGSMVSKITKRVRPEAVAGVACIKELVMALDELRVPTQSVQLSRDGCVDTDIELDRIMDVLKNNNATKKG